MIPKLYTVKELTGRLGIKERMTRRLLSNNQKQLKGLLIKAGRQWLIHPDAIKILKVRQGPGRPKIDQK